MYFFVSSAFLDFIVTPQGHNRHVLDTNVCLTAWLENLTLETETFAHSHMLSAVASTSCHARSHMLRIAARSHSH